MSALPPSAFSDLTQPALLWLEQLLLDAAHGAPQPIDLADISPDLQPIANAANALIQRSQTILQRSEALALRDALTGLPNRIVLRRFVDGRLRSMAEGDAEQLALLYFDLDHFKVVNDSLGHSEGDRLLKLATERVGIVLAQLADNGVAPSGDAYAGHARADHLFARIGGDEFAICLTGPDVAATAETVARRVLGILREPFELAGGSVSIGASIGVAIAPLDGTSHDALIRHADTAMYHAKERGRNQARRFHTSLNERAQTRVELATQLRQAIADDEFVLHYQPQYRVTGMDSGGAARHDVIAVEALLRWQHPRRGLLQPASFIGVAEDMNLIGEIGQWVIDNATRTITRWHRAGIPLRVSVNISPSELSRETLVDGIRSWLEDAATPPHLLELEVTETHVMSEDPAVARRLLELRRLGVTFAIDDFGTGYSNLARLAELPIDRLKLDRSLIRDLGSRTDHRTIVQSVIHLARGIDLDVIAEGVETDVQLELLRAMGCDVMQGFLLGHPMTEDALIKACTEARAA